MYVIIKEKKKVVIGYSLMDIEGGLQFVSE